MRDPDVAEVIFGLHAEQIFEPYSHWTVVTSTTWYETLTARNPPSICVHMCSLTPSFQRCQSWCPCAFPVMFVKWLILFDSGAVMWNLCMEKCNRFIIKSVIILLLEVPLFSSLSGLFFISLITVMYFWILGFGCLVFMLNACFVF